MTYRVQQSRLKDRQYRMKHKRLIKHEGALKVAFPRLQKTLSNFSFSLKDKFVQLGWLISLVQIGCESEGMPTELIKLP